MFLKSFDLPRFGASLVVCALVAFSAFAEEDLRLIRSHWDAPAPHPAAEGLFTETERITIPEGTFLMGADTPDSDHSPRHEVHLDAYEISQFEVTWGQYLAFIEAGGYENKETSGLWSRYGEEMSRIPLWTMDYVDGQELNGPLWDPDPSGTSVGPARDSSKGSWRDRGLWPPDPGFPVLGVSYWEAEAFCKFVGGRLPTEAEWEKAASWGPGATAPRTYPWGEDESLPIPVNAWNTTVEGTSPPESVDDPNSAGDVTRYGVRGMGGNVREWVADMYDPEFYRQGLADGSRTNPFNFQAHRFDYRNDLSLDRIFLHMTRGTHYGEGTGTLGSFTCFRRNHGRQYSWLQSFYRDHTIGFRVVWDTQRVAPKTFERVTRAKVPGAAEKVPAATYRMGHPTGVSGDVTHSSKPQHEVCLNDYWIGTYEVTWHEYRKFIEAGGYENQSLWSDDGWIWRTTPPGSFGTAGLEVTTPAYHAEEKPVSHYRADWKGPWEFKNGIGSPPDDHPVFGISWFEAEAYCNFVKGRLPTEAEWEVAASWNRETGEPMVYPWGNLFPYKFEKPLGNSGDDAKYVGFQSSPVGMYPDGKSSFGCYDMAGNVFEWCADWSIASAYEHTPECGGFRPFSLDLVKQHEPGFPILIGNKELRGGGFDPGFNTVTSLSSRTRVGGIGDGRMDFRNYSYGFRVAWDEDPAGIPEAQAVRPDGWEIAAAPDAPPEYELPDPPPVSGVTAVGVWREATVLDGTIDQPGKEMFYEIVGPAGALVEIDLDANGGSDDPEGTSPLDSVIEIWHESDDFPSKVRDDELIPVGDRLTEMCAGSDSCEIVEEDRISYLDPPIATHRIPVEGSFWVKVRAYYWPAEGSQANLDRGDRSRWGTEYSYTLTLTAPEVETPADVGSGPEPTATPTPPETEPTATPTEPTTTSELLLPYFDFEDPAGGVPRYPGLAGADSEWYDSRHAEAFAMHPSGEGFYILDSYGKVYPVGDVPWPMPGVEVDLSFDHNHARDLTLSPNGDAAYLLDGNGVIHVYGDGSAPRYGSEEWSLADWPGGPTGFGWDASRDLKILFDESGAPSGFYLLDLFGKVWKSPVDLPMFQYGDESEGKIPYIEWDIYRGFAVPPARDGFYLVDGYGKVWLAGNTLTPAYSGGREPGKLVYPGRDLMTDLEISSTGGGILELDAHGDIYTFGDFELPFDVFAMERGLVQPDGSMIPMSSKAAEEEEPAPKAPAEGEIPPLAEFQFFSAGDRTHGLELWAKDNARNELELVRDIAVGPAGSSPELMTVVGDRVFFSADDGKVGKELWKTDGTPEETRLVKDIHPTESSFPVSLKDFEGRLVFVADNGEHGRELWTSDGTGDGTLLLKDVHPGPNDFGPEHLTKVDGTLYFATDDGEHGNELWKTDGTPEGTVLVKDITPGENYYGPENLTAMGGLLFFTTDDEERGQELWRSDGTVDGTFLLKDIAPKDNFHGPEQLLAAGGTLYFVADDEVRGLELWKSDGSEAGTALLVDLLPGPPGSEPDWLTHVGDRVYFTASDASGEVGLWKTDGTAEGTVQVMDSTALGGSEPTALSDIDGSLFFTLDKGEGRMELWQTDGTAEGAALVNVYRK